MRAMTRTFVSVATAAGIAAGTLGAAGTSFAATPAQQSAPAVSAEAVAPLAVVNLGLSTAQAKKVQGWLKRSYGYTGAIDGQLGTNSWKAFQRFLRHWGYDGAIDGVVGSGTVKALQRSLKNQYGYTGAIDGIAGPGTQAAFKRLADRL
ncbi:peptidoglycan-binding protein [Streptomyces sp. SID8374]|uniref:peptidoglycan-binding domain-containing protein n=1 Tax=unclassified Streptomyces TaxID=2593676 RepID=UPI00081F591F|nr:MULTISPECIES: peptidoglycan-binding domain-containing protein [unclassified Streptomyces]MYR95417.1 peptidoglycan-binding protein [Streptomyces sp. SID4937]MYX12648.1 peptidoglycan-binding protein [Streptomyces sp. SID8374]SCD89929.1 Predicted Peptidoglycan domain-containing protein [Streptomyces sp. ScaeMP-e83]